MTGIRDLLSSNDDDVVVFQYDPAQRYQQQQQSQYQLRPQAPALPSLSVLMQPRGAAFAQSPYSQQQSWSPASATSSVDSASGFSPQTQQTRTARPPCSCGCDPVSSDDEAMLMLPRPVDNNMGISPTNKSLSDAGPPAAAGPVKKSRYLREMDRRAILARLDKGEKQSVLAKEYQVSRSSICNLFKHRDEVLSRVNQNPFTKHPKKPRTAVATTSVNNSRATEKLITCAKATYSPFVAPSLEHQELNATMMSQVHYDASGRIHRVNSRAASVLLSILDKPELTAAEFCRCANQLMLLLIEEALVKIPTLPASARGLSPLCAITMEQANQHAILDVFHSVEPHCPRGYVQFERSQWHQDVKIKLLDAQLSSALCHHNVVLLDVAVTSPPTVGVVIESLLRNGALEANITLVAVFVTRAVVELVQTRFPAVRVIATEIESGLVGREPMLMPRSMLFKQRLETLQLSTLVV